jgi:hypothetical protein
MVTRVALLLSLTLPALGYAAAPPQSAASAAGGKTQGVGGERFARTELDCGTARPDTLPPVSEAAFQNVLDHPMTPAFPDGLTLLKGLGQFRGADGVAIEEDSFLVIRLCPADARRESSAKSGQSREEYKEALRHKSVLRSTFAASGPGSR